MVVRQVADAGWTADEVIAWLDLEDAPARVLHPSGLLARRLDGALRLWPTAEERARVVAVYREPRRAEQARHIEWEGSGGPARQSVARLVDERAPRGRAAGLQVTKVPTKDPGPEPNWETQNKPTTVFAHSGASDRTPRRRPEIRARRSGRPRSFSQGLSVRQVLTRRSRAPSASLTRCAACILDWPPRPWCWLAIGRPLPRGAQSELSAQRPGESSRAALESPRAGGGGANVPIRVGRFLLTAL